MGRRNFLTAFFLLIKGYIIYAMTGKIRINSGSGKKVLVNSPGRPSTAHVNRPSGSPIPIKTGKDIGVSSYPVYLRNTTNTAEIGTAANQAALVVLLNADPGWSAIGTWTQDSNGIFCTGTPTKIIGYNKVGTLFNQTVLADWTYSDGDITLAQESSALRFTTTNNGATHRITLAGYQKTFLTDIEISFTIEVISLVAANGFRCTMGLDGARPCSVAYSSVVTVNDNGQTTNYSAGSLGYTTGTYDFKMILHANEIGFEITKGGSTITGTRTTPPTATEYMAGNFYIQLLGLDCRITNMKVNCIAYKNVDYMAVGDSVTWGRGADTWAGTWFNQVVGSQPSSVFAHGNEGMVTWNDCIAQLQAVNPAVVFIMGSYVDTPAGLSTFQSRYNTVITAIKTGSALQRIYHCASFPNNFSEDIRPFNNWKAATFTTGIDRYLDDYYALLLEGSSGYDLNNSYDFGGSHLTQAAQTIVANSMLLEL